MINVDIIDVKRNAYSGSPAQGSTTRTSETATSVFQQQDKNKVETKQKFDYSIDDGKISAGGILKNFGKGIISPFTSLFQSPKNLAIGVGVMAAGALLIAATGGAAAPILVAAGATMGAIQIGKGAYKAGHAQTDEEAEQAWQNIGAGVSAIGLSALGAKSSLKAAGVDSSNINMLEATAECIKIVPRAGVASVKNIGTTLGNLNNLGGSAAPQVAAAGTNKLNIQYNGSEAAALKSAIATVNAAEVTACAAIVNGILIPPTGKPAYIRGKFIRRKYSDPSKGMSSEQKTNIQDPKEIKFKSAKKTIDKNTKYTDADGKIYYKCKLVDSDTTVEYWGDSNGKIHTLIKVSRMNSDDSGLVVKFPNNGKYSWGASLKENLQEYPDYYNESDIAEAFCKDFAEAATGFCKYDDQCTGIKYLTESIKIKGHTAESSMELKVFANHSVCQDARFFASKASYDEYNNVLTVNCDIYCPHSPLHIN